MAVIKFKRGSGVPTGLTAYEAAWDTSVGRFFINNGSTAVWIGARIDPATDLGAAGSCAFFVPTQLAVKTYVDGQVAGGAVSSVNGATGAVSIFGGTGISVTSSAAIKGITIGVNSNVALLDTAQTFTALKSFSAGVSASAVNATLINNLVLGKGLSLTAGNIAIGDSTLPDITSGARNIGIGSKALSTTTSGGSNVAVGPDSLRSNTTGSSNVSIGDSSLYNNSSGKYNVSVGVEALYQNGDDANTALGYQALRNGSGNNNTGIGLGSLGNILTGNENVGLGANAGVGISTGASLTSATGGVFIGSNARASAQGQTNEIAIGRNSIALGSNTTVLGASTQTAAYIYGLVNAMSGLSAPGATFSGAVRFLGGLTASNLVAGVTGTVNQITVSGNTGSVTISLPSSITTPGSLATTTSLSVGTDLTVTGNLTVNGTTTTVNSNTVTIQDPVIAIGGAGTTNAPPPSGDVKDRGIIFQYNSSGGKTGFFGHDQSTGYFTYIPNISSLSADVVTGTAGTAQFNEVRGLSGVTFTITAPATTSSIIEMRGGAVYNNTLISLESSIVEIGNYGSRSGIKFTEGGRGHLLYPAGSMSANRTYDLPDHSGAIVVPSDLGVGGYILSSQGPTSQPVWIKPDEAGTGITASAAKLVTVSSSTDTTSFLTFIDTASNSNQAIRYNSSLAYNATTNYLDVNIDCGTY